jgi:hypothetical protein
VRLFQTLGVEAEFLGHLDQLPGSFGIPDGLGQSPGSVGLVSVVIGLGHGSTFQKYVPIASKRFEVPGAGLEFVFRALFLSLNLP